MLVAFIVAGLFRAFTDMLLLWADGVIDGKLLGGVLNEDRSARIRRHCSPGFLRTLLRHHLRPMAFLLGVHEVRVGDRQGNRSGSRSRSTSSWPPGPAGRSTSRTTSISKRAGADRHLRALRLRQHSPRSASRSAASRALRAGAAADLCADRLPALLGGGRLRHRSMTAVDRGHPGLTGRARMETPQP